MVIKGGARGGPVALAAHLERTDTNERVTIRELHGVTARDLRGALQEMDSMAAAAESRRRFYHANIDTRIGEELTEAQKAVAIERLAAKLGMSDQARAVVEHVKAGREHLHVVFLRIDLGRMAAIPDGHNYRKHEEVARELEREFGHERVQGAHVGRDGCKRPDRTPTHPEMQQADRSGLTPQEAKARVTELWNQADSGRAFAAALESDGWILARGDRRDFVLLDRAGETHSLGRRIDGGKAAQIRDRMADVDPASLPSVEEARARQRDHGQGDRIQPAVDAPMRTEPEIVVLKVEIPAYAQTHRPLELTPAPLDKAQPEQQEQTASVIAGHMPEQRSSMEIETLMASPNAEQIDAISRRPAPAMFQQLYTAAAEITQRVLDKARHLFDRQPKRLEAGPELKPEPPAIIPELPWIDPKPETQCQPEPKVQVEKAREQADQLIQDLIGRGRDIRSHMTVDQLRAELERQRGQERDGPGL